MSRNLSAIAKALLEQRPLLVSAVAAVAAILFAAGYLSRREAEILRVAEPVEAVVSARDIAPGEFIDGASIRIANVPRRFLQPAALQGIDDAVGRIAAVPLRAGTQLTSALARLPSRGTGVAAIVPAGRRAFAVFPDEDPSGLVRPDDAVDVLATFDLGNEAAVRRTTLAIAENVSVLAVGSDVAGAAPSPARREAGGLFEGRAMVPPSAAGRHSVTLAVTPAQAQALAFAQASGRIALTLRPTGEEAVEGRAPPTTIATITGGHDELAPLRKGFREYRGR